MMAADMLLRLQWGILALALSGVACTASVGSEIAVPPDAAQMCAEQCEAIELRMTAVAIMANTVGCVCQPRSATGADVAHQTASTAAGMSTIMLQREAEQRRQASHHHHVP